MLNSMRVGYCWSERKGQKINVNVLAQHFIDRGYEFVKIDLDEDLEQQGPFDAIINKMNDLLCKIDIDNDEIARRQVKAFEEYIEAHPEIIVIDRLNNVRKVLDRYRQYKIIEDSELAKEDGVFTPSFVEMTSTNVDENLSKMKAANVKFPFVCKPIRAQGTRFAHKMSIIFDENGLRSINPPCVAQTFINHNARLFKLFIIKDKYFSIERPSIKNFKPDKHYDTVHFDSHDISKPYSCSSLIELEEDEKSCHIIEPDPKILDRIVKIVFNELGLYLLGIDVIIENGSGRYAIIDMNSFPGYDGVDNFLELFCQVVIDEIEQARKNLKNTNGPTTMKNNHNYYHSITNNHNQSKQIPMNNGTNNNHNIYSNDFDSGIDTSDSCDEKKNPNKDYQQQPTKFYKKQHSRFQQPTTNHNLNSVSEHNLNEKC